MLNHIIRSKRHAHWLNLKHHSIYFHVIRCGYSPKNSSYYNIQSPPLSSKKDCKLFGNNITIKCFNCDICKYMSHNHYIFVQSIHWTITKYFHPSLLPSLSIHTCSMHSCFFNLNNRGVVAHHLRKEWRIIALTNIIIFTMLVR